MKGSNIKYKGLKIIEFSWALMDFTNATINTAYSDNRLYTSKTVDGIHINIIYTQNDRIGLCGGVVGVF